MNVVLKQDIKGLGYNGDVVKVAIGYARNFLIPQGLGVFATPAEVKKSEQVRSERIARHEEVVKNAKAIADKLEGTTLTFARKVSKGDKLFGGVSESDIATALLEQAKTEIDKSQVHLSEGHLKTLGEHQVDVHLYEGKHVTITVQIEAEEK